MLQGGYMRLDKFLSNSLNISRSLINAFIKKNEIFVNGNRVTKKDFKIDEDKDIVIVNGNIIEYKEFVYYMLNKPKGYVSAVKDNVDKTVVELIDTNYEVFPIGRLDKDTEGLLILTNNGSLCHHLTNPNHHVLKKYLVISDLEMSDDELLEFKKGIYIKDKDGEEFLTKECNIEKIDSLKYHVYIEEGKFHQVKRMFGYFNKKVMYLKRLQMGSIILDENLKVGEYRELSREEVILLKENSNF